MGNERFELPSIGLEPTVLPDYTSFPKCIISYTIPYNYTISYNYHITINKVSRAGFEPAVFGS